MIGGHSTYPRVLAIDPTTRGFAYTVFEGPDLLIEWGLSQVRQDKKNPKCMARIRDLVARYDPEVIVLEDYDGAGSHRKPRVRALIRSIEALALSCGIHHRAFSRRDVRGVFPALRRPTKHSIAAELARRYPELSPRLPDERKCYESEDERMNLFDATSLAVTYFERLPKRTESVLVEAA